MGKAASHDDGDVRVVGGEFDDFRGDVVAVFVGDFVEAVEEKDGS